MPYEIRCTTMTKRDPNRKGIKPHGVNSGVMIAQRSVRPGEKILLGDAQYIRLQPQIQRYLECGLITIQKLPARVTAPSVITSNTAATAAVAAIADVAAPDLGDDVDMNPPAESDEADATEVLAVADVPADVPAPDTAVETAPDAVVDATEHEAAKIVQPAVRRTAAVRKVV